MNGLEITVLVSSSPIKTHPSTTMIEETIASIRYHLPESPIILMTDGVREEQLHLKEAYRQYRSELVTKMIKEWEGVTVYPFPFFLHQAVMTIKTLEMVESPMILFVEHDTPLMPRPIDWEMLTHEIRAGRTNHIRLHYDESIHKDHEHMMRGKLSDHLIKCVQWHQRPHLAAANWYELILQANFSVDSRTFIEDKIYSPVSLSEWEDYRLTIYDPEGTGQNMKRSKDLNGRGDEQKYSMIF